MITTIKKDGISVEIKLWDFETVETEAFVNPSVHKFFDFGGRLPGKKMVRVDVPTYKPENVPAMEQCYESCIRAVALGEHMCRSLTIPLLGVGSKGWSPEDSMRCAWKAVLKYAENTAAGFGSIDRLRKIVIACNASDYAAVKVYRNNLGHLFLRTPDQWFHHGDLFLWNYLMWRLAEYVSTAKVPHFEAVLKYTIRIFGEVTNHVPKRGEIYSAMPMKEFGQLAGMPIHSDFWLDVAIPLLLENFCIHYEELGFPPLDTIKVLIGNDVWTLPKASESNLNAIRGEKLLVLKTETGEEKKLTLKNTGLKYSPAVEKALKICFDAHKDQTDHSGLPYVIHPLHLAEQMETEEEICTALLHDVVEDSDYTIEDLKKAGFHEQVTDAVALLTHNTDVPYMDYIRTIRKNKMARKVKLADLTHNSDPKRKAIETEWERRRAGKYRIAKSILEDDRYDSLMGHYRKRIPLDDRQLYFLSVFYEPDGVVKKYSLDVEAASDSHTEFGPEAIGILKKRLRCKNSLPEALCEYFENHSEWDFRMLLSQCKAEYNVFHYGD